MTIPREIIFALSEPLMISAAPFQSPARKAGLTEAELLERIRKHKTDGQIRRLGAVLSHRKVGYRCNALVLWSVAPEKRDQAAQIISVSSAVTHCYGRKSCAGWPYNLYAMVHAKSKKECVTLVRSLTNEAGLDDPKMLFTLKEFKKIKTDLREILK